MNAAENKAVFLSYASQDAAAAKKICDALRAAGVEVWFDQSELRGGDAWDQKIRKQIRDCVLFLPVISAATQARREGYFRLEWKLADDRTHLMAKGTPFLVPVCVDETKDWDALVPDSFMTVQWTRLPGGETPPKFTERVVQLLSGEVAPVSDRRSEAASGANAGQRPALPQKKFPLGPLALGAVVVIGVGLFFAMRAKPSAPLTPGVVAVAPANAPAATAGARNWPHDPELKRAIALIDTLSSTREDHLLADEISARAVEKSPSDPEAVTVRARVHGSFLLRNFDFSSERTAQAKRYGERAVQLAPDDPEALYALSLFLSERAGDAARAEALVRRASELAPADSRFARQLVRTVVAQRPDEGLAQEEELVRRFPRDALAHYDLSIMYRNRREWESFERELDATLALAPIANAFNWKSRAALLRGNLPEMREWLDRVPAREHAEERTVVSSLIYASLSGDYDYGLKALQIYAQPWFFDVNYYAGPTALPTAMFLAQQGKTGLARAQYEEALAAVTRHHAENPTDQSTRRAEMWIYLGLGRREEARAIFHTALETLRHPYQVNGLAVWWLDAIPGTLLVGDRDTALQLIREAAAQPEGRKTIRHRMSADPRMAPFRDDLEIVALLAEPKTETSSAPPAALSPARELADKARGLLQGIDATREDFALAEDYCQRALKLDSADGEVWAAYSQVNAAFGYRGWDTSPERREQIRVTAERAIRLAPTSVQARLAQAGAWAAFGINRPETEKLLRDIVAERPDDKATIKFLAVTVLGRGGLDECLALNERSAALPGGDPLALFNNARYLWQRNRRAEGYATLERALAQNPSFGSGLVFKTMMELFWRSDLTAAEATLQKIPQAALMEDRASFTAGLVHYYQRRPDAALESWGAFPRDYFVDFAYDGPKGLLIGFADELDHRDAAAKIEWRTALSVVEKRIATTPNNPMPYYYQAYLLACLGEKAAAAESLATHEQLARIKFTAESPMSFDLALVYTRLGRFDEFFAHPPTSGLGRMKIDPRFDALRGDPRFEKLLATGQSRQPEQKK